MQKHKEQRDPSTTESAIAATHVPLISAFLDIPQNSVPHTRRHVTFEVREAELASNRVRMDSETGAGSPRNCAPRGCPRPSPPPPSASSCTSPGTQPPGVAPPRSSSIQRAHGVIPASSIWRRAGASHHESQRMHPERDGRPRRGAPVSLPRRACPSRCCRPHGAPCSGRRDRQAPGRCVHAKRVRAN